MRKSFLAAVLLSASVERVGVSGMRDFFYVFGFKKTFSDTKYVQIIFLSFDSNQH